MSLLDKMIVKETGYRIPIKQRLSPVINLSCVQTGEEEPAGLATRSEFLLSITCGVKFWCNQAQRKDAERNARKALLRRMHEDSYIYLQELKKAIYDGDEQTAFELIQLIEEGMGL